MGEPPVHAENLNRSPAAPFCGADPASNTCVVPESNHSGVPGVHAVPSTKIVRPDGDTVRVTRNCSVYVAGYVPAPVTVTLNCGFTPAPCQDRKLFRVSEPTARFAGAATVCVDPSAHHAGIGAAVST